MVKMQQKESARLKERLTEAHAEPQEKNAEQARQLALRLQKIEQQHAVALKQLFGSKSERGDKARTQQRDNKPQTGHGPRPQDKLFPIEVHHRIEEQSLRGRTCTECRGALKEWEGQHEASEEIDFVEPQVMLKRHLRHKYRCRCGACILTAPGPKKLFKKARYSIDFALNIALQKYCYHMPLARQVRELGRRHLDVTTATLWDYLKAMHALLKPAFERLPEHIMASSVIGVDETTWRVLDGKKKGKADKWWVWARQCQDAVHYAI